MLGLTPFTPGAIRDEYSCHDSTCRYEIAKRGEMDYRAAMKTLLFKLREVVGFGLTALFLAGCSTPGSRIKDNPELFGSLPEEVQAKVQSGQIGIGFSQDAVFLALGKPDREYTRTTATGQVVVWSYIRTITNTDRQRVNVDVRYRDRDGRSRSSREWVWVDVNRDREFEHTRVELIGGVVTAIEEVSR